MFKSLTLKFFLLLIAAVGYSVVIAQSQEYEAKKAKSLAGKSVFEKIVDRELPATVLYEDDEIMAFVPLRK